MAKRHGDNIFLSISKDGTVTFPEKWSAEARQAWLDNLGKGSDKGVASIKVKDDISQSDDGEPRLA